MNNQNQPTPAHQTASVQEPQTGYAFKPDTEEIVDLEDGQVIAVLSDGATREQGYALVAAYNRCPTAVTRGDGADVGYDISTGEIVDLEDGQVIAVLSDGATHEQGLALAAAYNLADSDGNEPSLDSPAA